MATTRLAVGDPIPYVLTREELADQLGISLDALDAFRRAKNHPAIKELDGPGHPRFCGRTFKAWLDGGAVQPVRGVLRTKRSA